MSQTVSTKSTKTEIWEAYNAIKKKLDEMEAMKDDPMKEVVKAEEKRISASAAEIVEKNILNPEIVKVYQDLQQDIANKQKVLKELYNIEAEANSMVAMINAHKEKEVELKAKFDALKNELDAEIEEKRINMEAEIESLKVEKVAIMEEIETESEKLKEELDVQRERDEEEYEYDLKRNRKKADDIWNDEKNAREKELADKEIAVELRETVVSEKEAYIAELEQKVSEISTLIESAKEEGIKKGKADAEKSYVFEKRTIETKNEYEQKALRDKIAILENDIQETKKANQILQDKLDGAYTQMRELASETVKSSGGVKILNNETSGK